MKKKILIALACLVAIAGVFCAIYFPNSEINNTISEIQDNIISEVVVTEETQELVDETLEAIENSEEIETTEVLESSEEEEATLEEEDIEVDAQAEQENIAWEGTNSGDGLSLLGEYQGLTYYNQTDSRWGSLMYSSTGNSSQTIASSGCGPTAAAIVVSSSKGTILPSTMASLFVDNGYRTASNGTAWSAFSFVADYFDFSEYYTTSNFSTALSYLETDNDNDGTSDYFVVVSCGSGLFTTGGHYIVLVAEDNDTLTVYDPYLYSGKFDTASRRQAGVVVSGNNVYVTESAFQTYANYRNFWIFSNDKGSGNTTETTSVNYTRYVSTSSANLNVRSGAGTSYSIIGSLAKGTAVTVTQVKGNWSYISSPISGWVSSSYLSASSVSTSSTSSTTSSYTRYVNTSSKNLNVRSGAGTSYSVIGSLSKGTAVTVSRTSGTWSYITSPITGWVSTSYLSSSTTSSSSSYTTGTYKVTGVSSSSVLCVRTGAGTSYSKKTYNQLTSNARSQNKALGNYYANGYKNGVVCTVTQVNGNWGKTASGWICLDYCTKQ